VQINSEPIHPVLSRIREKLSFLGTKRTVNQKLHNNTMIYNFYTEIPPVINMRLKIEINTREHLHIMGFKEIPFEINTAWFSGKCAVTGYKIEELLSTKLKALYCRKKGRDLFDMYCALTNLDIDIEKLLFCNKLHYEHAEKKPPTDKQFIINMADKLTEREYTIDIFNVLKPNTDYNPLIACEIVREKLGIVNE